MYRKISHPGMGPCPPRVALAIRTSDWGFHTVQGVIDPGGHRFRPRFVGVVDMRKGFWSRDGILFRPGWRELYESQVWVSMPRGALSTRRTTVFVHSLLEL